MPKPLVNQPIDVSRITDALDQWIAQRPEPAASLKSLVQQLKPKLVQARAKGMTYQQLAEFMAEQGFPCSVSTLKAHLATRRSTKRKPAHRTTNNPFGCKAVNTRKPSDSSTLRRQKGIKGGIADDEI